MSQYRYCFFLFYPDIGYGYSTYVSSKLQHTKLEWRVSTLSFVVESKRKFKNPSLLEAPLKFNWLRFLPLRLAGKAKGTTDFIVLQNLREDFISQLSPSLGRGALNDQQLSMHQMHKDIFITWQTTKIPIAEKSLTIVHFICLKGGSQQCRQCRWIKEIQVLYDVYLWLRYRNTYDNIWEIHLAFVRVSPWPATKQWANNADNVSANQWPCSCQRCRLRFRQNTLIGNQGVRADKFAQS